MFLTKSYQYIAITLAFFLSLNSLAVAGIYKWQDENGDIHYGQQPPAGLKSTATKPRVENSNKHKTIKPRLENASTNHLIPSKSIPIQVSNINGITRYVLRADEKIGQYTRWRSEMTISNNTVWVTFEKSILAFDLKTNKSKKYHLKNIQGTVSTQSMQISGDYFIFLKKEHRSSKSTLLVYNYKNNTHKVLPISSNPNTLYHYDDQYDDGIFSFDYKQNVLIQYIKVKNPGEMQHANEKKYRPDNNHTGPVATSESAIWQSSGKKKTCSVRLFDKKTGNTASFNYKKMGLPASNRCAWIVADDNEVWVTSRVKRFNTTFSIYNIKNKKWKHIKNSKNNIPLNHSPLQMDNESVYYISCEKLIAINRTTKNASILTTTAFNINPKRHVCISAYKIHDDHAWVLKFQAYKSRLTPILYKIPLNQAGHPN